MTSTLICGTTPKGWGLRWATVLCLACRILAPPSTNGLGCQSSMSREISWMPSRRVFKSCRIPVSPDTSINARLVLQNDTGIIVRIQGKQGCSHHLSARESTLAIQEFIMPQTLYDKLWSAHVVHQEPDGTCLLYIDRHLVHEVTSP